MSTKKTITITQSDYDDLLEYSAMLRALENAGVDNWDGYDFALDLLEEEKKQDELDE